MKNTHIVLGAFIAVAAIAQPVSGRYDTIQLKSGKTLFKCEIIGWSPTEAIIDHFQGLEPVQWDEIPLDVMEKIYSKQPKAEEIKKRIVAISHDQMKKTDGALTYTLPFREGQILISLVDTTLYSDSYPPSLELNVFYSSDKSSRKVKSGFLIFSDRLYKVETGFLMPDGIGKGQAQVRIDHIFFTIPIDVKERPVKPKKNSTYSYRPSKPLSPSDAKREALAASLMAQSAITAKEHELAATALRRAARSLRSLGLDDLAYAADGDAAGEDAIAKYLSGRTPRDFRSAASDWEQAAFYYRAAGLSSKSAQAEKEAAKLRSVAKAAE